jgi:hypothetical protein
LRVWLIAKLTWARTRNREGEPTQIHASAEVRLKSIGTWEQALDPIVEPVDLLVDPGKFSTLSYKSAFFFLFLL